MRKLPLIILVILIGFSFGKLKESKGYVIKKNKDGTYTLRIYLNYYDLSKEVFHLRGDEAIYRFKFPIPDRFIPLSGKVVLKYVSSPLLVSERSEIIVKLNGYALAYRRIGDEYRNNIFSPDVISVNVDGKRFKDYNSLDIVVHQHYTIKYCEDPSAPELWTDIYTGESYIEINFVYRIIPDEMVSLQSYIYDPKYLYFDRVNIVIDTEAINGDYLKALSLFIGSLANIYKYVDIKINVSDTLSEKGDNYIIGLRNFVSSLVKEKIDKDFLITSNPKNPVFKNIVITGDTYRDLYRSVLINFIGRINLFKSRGIKIVKEKIPEKLPPYSAPGFIPTGKKVYLRDLGIKTTTLGYGYEPELRIPYKIYPDILWGDKDKITFYLDMEYPPVVRKDSVVNVFANDIFLTQIPVVGKKKEEHFTFYAYTLPKGSGNFRISPSLIPFKEGFCEIYNRKNLVITLKETSYIYLPKGIHITEMPYLEFFASAGYPYSIYGDLQDTALILTSNDPDTVAAALKIVYFISQRTEYPPFYLTVLTVNELGRDKSVLRKNLIVVGPYNSNLANVYTAGAVKLFIDGNTGYTKPLKWSFRDVVYPVSELDKKKLERVISLITANGEIASFIQMFESPYEDGKTVTLVYSSDTEELKSFANLIFNLSTSYYIKGDFLIYFPKIDEAYSFYLNEKYVVGKAPQPTKVKYELSKDWKKYLLVVLLTAIAIGIVLYILLELYRRKRHKNVE
ncbi:cellulose biosynthesis cyclic di-GMP-binding regulatory protein BcsB [Aquifex pyrophilus]